MTIPTMTSVTSSNLHSIGHDGQALYVRFKGKDGAPGALYRYPTATDAHHKSLLSAASPGRHFTDVIRHFHPSEKVTE